MHFKIDCIELWKLCSNPPLLAPISESYPSPQAYFQSISFPSSVFLILNKNMNILCFFNRVEIFLPDQLRQGGVCFWLATNIIVVCSLVRESFVICGMLLYTSCWSLFPAYCGYHWTGASLSIIEDIIELDISVFVQKLDSLLKQEQNVLVWNQTNEKRWLWYFQGPEAFANVSC